MTTRTGKDGLAKVLAVVPGSESGGRRPAGGSDKQRRKG